MPVKGTASWLVHCSSPLQHSQGLSIINASRSMSPPSVSLILQPDRPSQAWLGSHLPDDRPKIKPPIYTHHSNHSHTELWLLLPCSPMCPGQIPTTGPCQSWPPNNPHPLDWLYDSLSSPPVAGVWWVHWRRCPVAYVASFKWILHTRGGWGETPPTWL